MAPNNRGEDGDAVFAFADLPADLAPGVKSCDLGGVGILGEDQSDVVRAVGVEPCCDLQHLAPLVPRHDGLHGVFDALVGLVELIGVGHW